MLWAKAIEHDLHLTLSLSIGTQGRMDLILPNKLYKKREDLHLPFEGGATWN